MPHSFPTRRSSDLLSSAEIYGSLAAIEQNSALTESFETAAAIGSNGVWINPVGRFARYGDTNSGASKIRDNSYGGAIGLNLGYADNGTRSEEHTSELQSLMRISYAVFCLK